MNGSLGGADVGGYGSPVAGLILVPILVLLTVPLALREARREGTRWIFWVLIAALVLKLLGAIVRYYLPFISYAGPADAARYHNAGAGIAALLRSGQFVAGWDAMSLVSHSAGTQTLAFATGVLYSVIGANMMGGFLVFSWASFLGLFMFYRAFRRAGIGGNHRLYAVLIFFLPSLLFWPSSIGKEAWMIGALGMAALGVAEYVGGSRGRGLALVVFALVAGALVRPHVAGMVALAIAVAIATSPPRGGWTVLAPVYAGAALLVIAALSIALVMQALTTLPTAGEETARVSDALLTTAERTTKGGSAFQPIVVTSPVAFPGALFTVLFRPSLLDVRGGLMLSASLEATVMLALTVVLLWRCLARHRGQLRNRYMIACFTFILLFIVGFSSFANFGLLVRERTQVLPFVAAILAAAPPRRKLL